jgi:hypothetical protein
MAPEQLVPHALHCLQMKTGYESTCHVCGAFQEFWKVLKGYTFQAMKQESEFYKILALHSSSMLMWVLFLHHATMEK